MSTEDTSDDLRYAEYVLGVLDAEARAAVAREITSSAAAAAAVAQWERQLAPLARDIPEVQPGRDVWQRILQALQWDAPARASRRPSLWQSVQFWRWLGISASVATVVCVTFLVIAPRQTHTVAATGMMVSSIKQANGVASWTATIDITRRQLILVPATPAAVAQNRSTELWLIPQGKMPIAMGVFNADAVTTLLLSQALVAQLGSTAALAVSVEPIGGSPTGQPTGPVIATGSISGAPSA
jgi:anti-sigma-K factor RskA